jgi:hypothetical protein
MIELAPERIAAEAGAEVLQEGSPNRPARASIDSRHTEPGDLFFGLIGESADGGRKIPFDDREVAREELRRLAAPASSPAP